MIGSMMIYVIAVIALVWYFTSKNHKNQSKGGAAVQQKVSTSGAAAKKEYYESQARSKAQSSVAVNRAMQQPGNALFAEDAGKAYLKMDDRKNDWLARQLEEERRAAYRVSAMFGFKYNAKADHAANCDAREIRQEHSKNCDAEGIDNARGK
ncbi:MAG: hypothetical protein IJT16_13820 [Lachnospiraceae bacterium]|nr:hypothetical protein [Lachnospiraceae bacterium]